MNVKRWAIAAVASLTVVALAACSAPTATESGQEPAGSDDAAFPITIGHAYGETVIEAKPERIATVAWANHEVPLALDVVPVGMARATWGDDDDNGVLPWVEEKLAEIGAETPVLFDETQGIDFEAVADTQPDVILAAYSGITEEDYDTLSRIAPTVAFPVVPWGSSYEEMIALNSEAMGMSAEGEALTAELEGEVRAALAEYPDLEGATVMFANVDPTDLSTITFYTTHDTRPRFFSSIGMGTPRVVEEESANTEAFFSQVSAERADEFDDVDLIIGYGDQSVVEQMQADPLMSQIPAVERGSVAMLANGPEGALANPSPLSIPYGQAELFGVLNEHFVLE